MSAGVGPLQWLLSHLRAQRLERVTSAVHPQLSVRVVDGRLRLDARLVNHSGGRLLDAWSDAFDALVPEQRRIERVLLLGLGGGSALELLRGRGVRAPIDAVELDPSVVRVAREHFRVERWQPLSIHVADALAWIALPGPSYELVLVDLFVEDAIPVAVRAEPFLQALRARLAPGGLLVLNQLAHTPRHAAAAESCAVLAGRVLGPSRLLACDTNRMLVHESDAPS